MQGFLYTQLKLSHDLDDLHATWFEVLLRLHRAPGSQMPMNRMATEMTMTSGGFTKLADRMAEAGLIRRNPSAEDRRVTFVELTPSGRDLAAKSIAEHVTSLRNRVLGALSAEDVARLAAIMRELRSANSDGEP